MDNRPGEVDGLVCLGVEHSMLKRGLVLNNLVIRSSACAFVRFGSTSDLYIIYLFQLVKASGQ